VKRGNVDQYFTDGENTWIWHRFFL